MKKYINIWLKIILSLILLLPILGLLGIFPEPTADLYNNEQAFDFIMMLNIAWYISYITAGVHIVAFTLSGHAARHWRHSLFCLSQ